ncbi:type II toxin-antitoxin system VapC family toxin [Glycomyces buryatensis]|uniref:Ribonuclease VapC n=1 Tax=Glycomyces buryatensis TaxID=2570927 RepID=A0A4V4HSZ4_9ACTN|nr:type II toxin-antitoxin system VapC family toxin [Glycomyces buryatensis]THV43576.1 type II toxin-antitoxin system VapC family toxin [Glycomyces buryatensis]
MGVIVDSNVVSELMRSEPDAGVLAWFDGLPEDEVWISAVAIGEVVYGVSRLDDGKRKTALLSRIDILVNEVFRGRCAALDAAAGYRAGVLNAELEKRGIEIGLADVQIAATCLVRGDVLATRNVKHFKHTGVEWINPWGE